MNLAPTSTGSATAIALIFPELKGKLNGLAVRVPLTNSSITDCVFEVSLPACQGLLGVKEGTPSLSECRQHHLLRARFDVQHHTIQSWGTSPSLSTIRQEHFTDSPSSTASLLADTGCWQTGLSGRPAFKLIVQHKRHRLSVAAAVCGCRHPPAMFSKHLCTACVCVW